MKKIFLLTFLVGLTFFFAGCETYEDLFPEEYHVVLNFKDGMEKEVELSLEGATTEVGVSVMKTGSEDNSVASGLVEVMSEEDFKAIAEKYNIKGVFLAPEFYTLNNNELSFTGDESYKFVNVSLKNDEIKALTKKNIDKVALPLKLSSTDATVNTNMVIILVELS